MRNFSLKLNHAVKTCHNCSLFNNNEPPCTFLTFYSLIKTMIIENLKHVSLQILKSTHMSKCGGMFRIGIYLKTKQQQPPQNNTNRNSYKVVATYIYSSYYCLPTRSDCYACRATYDHKCFSQRLDMNFKPQKSIYTASF